MINHHIRSLRATIREHQFLSAVGLVILITALFTFVSMTLYIRSGASGLDLSRPGFSDSRRNIQSESAPTFGSTGPLTESDLQQFRTLFAKQRKALDTLSSFDDEALSDETLGFTFLDEALPGNQ